MTFRNLQRLCKYELREATESEIAALHRDGELLRQYPMDPGSPVGVNERVVIIVYLSGGDLVHAALPPKDPEMTFRNLQRGFGLGWFVMALIIVAFVGALFYFSSKTTAREQAYCEARGGVYIKSRDGGDCIKGERIQLP